MLKYKYYSGTMGDCDCLDSEPLSEVWNCLKIQYRWHSGVWRLHMVECCCIDHTPLSDDIEVYVYILYCNYSLLSLYKDKSDWV